ncbi:hypothetical protein [Stenotrophomonas sp.]|uniref:hypothetical protein n=1 Tax=Stenotrophomonas sp. TaxID=69392 RepID=UPI002FC66BB4
MGAPTDAATLDTATLLRLLDDLEQVVPVVDRIGSGFEDTEAAALALLLFFRERQVLDRLAGIRKALTVALAARMTPEALYAWEESMPDYWAPPYDATRAQLLARLNAE